MKLYRFRELNEKDQMHIEVDFGGEPVEVDEKEIIKAFEHLIFTASKLWDEVKPIKNTDAMTVTHPIIEEAKAIIQHLTQE